MAIPINLLLRGCECWPLRTDLLHQLELFVHRSIRKILNINMTQVREQQIILEKLREWFNKIPSLEALIDTRRMYFLGKIVRGPVTLPPKELLIVFCTTNRTTGGPILCNKGSLLGSLKRLLKDVQGIHIDTFGSLKDLYLDALDETFWKRCVERLKDPSKPIPRRFNREVSFNPRSSRRQRRSREEERNAESEEEEREETEEEAEFNEDKNSYADSLKILGLGYDATWNEVKSKFRILARKYHSDQHKPEQTGLSNEQAVQHFQLINNAQEYLLSKLTWCGN